MLAIDAPLPYGDKTELTKKLVSNFVIDCMSLVICIYKIYYKNLMRISSFNFCCFPEANSSIVRFNQINPKLIYETFTDAFIFNSNMFE